MSEERLKQLDAELKELAREADKMFVEIALRSLQKERCSTCGTVLTRQEKQESELDGLILLCHRCFDKSLGVI